MSQEQDSCENHPAAYMNGTFALAALSAEQRQKVKPEDIRVYRNCLGTWYEVS